MKNILIILTLLMFTFSPTFSQELIENPEKPKNKDAGRILQLEEILRIQDDGGDFYFKSPRMIKVAPDGSIFIYDQEQLLRFDENGKFKYNYFLKGQGPGEIEYLSNYVVLKEKLIIHSRSPSKLIYFSLKGELQDEISLQEMSTDLRLHFYKDGTFYFIKSEFPRTDKGSEVMDWDQRLVSLSGDMNTLIEHENFPIETLVVGGGAVSNMSVYTALVQNRYLFVSHTSEYMLHIFDIDSNKRIKSVTRKYKRVKRPKDQRSSAIIMEGKRFEPPGSELLADVSQILEFKGDLWVQTSTKDKEGRSLYDVLDIEGVYLDSFYLNLNGTLVSTYGDYIFVRERDEDDLISIVKYKVIDWSSIGKFTWNIDVPVRIFKGKDIYR
ncbi:MAG: 6-bladed beta-propeller [Candidatus Aminicenantes bacterium]|nr:6-bladed beta-propeller [Candidatus Aminicenantes bacterium]